LFKTLTKGERIIYQEGFKRKLAAMLSAGVKAKADSSMMRRKQLSAQLPLTATK